MINNDNFFAVRDDGVFFMGKGHIGFRDLARLRQSMSYWRANKSRYTIYRTYINNGVPVTEVVQ